MDKIDIKQKIQEEISKTEQLVTEYKENTKPVAPDVSIGRISRMDAINNKSVAEAALRQAEQKLTRLKYVLSIADTSDFGKCTRCGGMIPLGRVLVRPESTLCVNCAR
ncbi:MAG: TraR/DksA C4-type zinc finger protein [Dysgonomonas sp.]|nr:TraR/DksA C4-type zinc finger protein [Dysgonomonas sp.]